MFACTGAFDPVSQYCGNNYAACALAPKCEVDRQVFPYPDNKFTFFRCKLQKDEEQAVIPVYELHKGDCKKGLKFDAELGYYTLPLTEWVSGESGSAERFECSRVGKFIDFSSGFHYIACVVESVPKSKLKPIQRKCPMHTVFSGEKMECIRLVNIF